MQRLIRASAAWLRLCLYSRRCTLQCATYKNNKLMLADKTNAVHSGFQVKYCWPFLTLVS